MSNTITKVLKDFEGSIIAATHQYGNQSWNTRESASKEAIAEIKHIIEEAKPVELTTKDFNNYSPVLVRGFNTAIDVYHNNLLKVLGE